jgi:4-oxalocrotonate tautomerase
MYPGADAPLFSTRRRQETAMPFVEVHMWEGRTVEQKRALTRAINDAMVEHAGANPEALHIAIQEYSKENWARAGVLGVDRTDV